MTINRFLKLIKKTGCEFEENKSIINLTSIKINTVAKAILFPDSLEKLISSLNILCDMQIPFVVVGRMSNVLFSDRTYNGVIVVTTKLRGYSLAENKVDVLCGECPGKMALGIAKSNLGGFEGIVGIPGTLGGMLRSNAGAYGSEISDRFFAACIYDLKAREVHIYSKADMQFSYRTSILKDRAYVLLSAVFEPVEKSYNEIISTVSYNSEQRKRSQPTLLPSLGSVFKKCNGVSAGYYIDRLGLKGYSIGDAQISEKHAGFIINRGNATAADIISLVEFIKTRVNDAFGIELEEEIEII